MPKFQKGHPRYGGRQKGVLTRGQTDTMVTGTPWLALLCVLFGALSLGCRRQVEDGPITRVLRAYQSRGIVIGNLNSPDFESIDFKVNSQPELSSTPQGVYQRVGVPNASLQKAADGRISGCDKEQCTISDPKDDSRTVLFKSTGVLTPLYWSPDGRYLLFVRTLPTTRLPLRCRGDEEHDVLVYEPVSRTEEIVTTVCGGYPYRRFGWFVREAP
jgi:hypothetical protein